MLSEDRKKEYLSIDFNDIATLRDVVSHKYDKANNKIIKPKFPATEEFVLEKGEYYNDQKIVTTVGRYMVNRAVFRDKILSLIGYQNKVITAKVYSGDIDRTLTELLRNDKLTVQDFKDYVTRLENFSTSLINTTTNSFTEKTVATNAKVAKRKQELLKKYEKELANNDIAIAVKIENELVDLAKKELEGDPGMDSYNSGARGSFGSNYKELNIMKGPVFNPVTREWDIVETSYDDGLAKKDLHVHGNSIATGVIIAPFVQ